VPAPRAIAILGLAAAIGSVACSTLLSPEPTPVPGAAATLTRSINTPIPTPVRTPSAVPGASPSPAARPAASPVASASPSAQVLSDQDVADVQHRFEQMLASSNLPGLDELLLDHVSLSTPDGGSVLSQGEAATWLRDHAGPGLEVTQVDRGTQEVMLVVLTDGWPKKDPIQQGQVSFSLRRYDADGRQDESGGGEWKIDVISVD
jgi:hypothetical protein